jgi:tetratricopeptide (TPR) repeat protein
MSDRFGDRAARLAARSVTLVVLAEGALFVLALTRGDLTAAGVATGALAAQLAGTWLDLCVIIVAVLLQQWAIAALVAVNILLRGVPRLALALSDRPPDPTALAEQLAGLDDSLVARLRAAAVGGTITTREMVLVAAGMGALDLRGKDPGSRAFDGPLVEDGRSGPWSQYAVEALAVARALARPGVRSLDDALLATSATLIPLSAAAEWAGLGPGDRDPGISSAELVEAMRVVADSPVGTDLLRRIEIVQVASPGLFGVHSRETLAAVSPRRLLLLNLLVKGVPAWAWASILAGLGLDLLRWLARLPGRVVHRLARVGRSRWHGSAAGPPTPEAAAGPPATVPAAPPSVRSLTAAWRGWPPEASLLWLVGRPLLAVAAIACAAVVDGIWAAFAVAVAASVRPLRLRLLGWLAALAVAPLSLVGAVLLFARALIGEFVIWRLGFGAPDGVRAAGLARIVASRLKLAGRLVGHDDLRLEGARATFDQTIAAGDDEGAFDPALFYVLAAWAEVRPWELLRALRRGIGGIAFGQWDPENGHTDSGGELRRLAVQEELATRTTRWGVILTAAVLTALLLSPGAGLVDLDSPLAELAAGVVLILIASAISRRPPSPSGGLIGLLAGFALFGGMVVPLAGVGLVAGLIARELRDRAGESIRAGRSRWTGWRPPQRTRPWHRRHWKVAEVALDAGRWQVAIEVLRDLAGSRRAPAPLAAAALSRVALVEVEHGRLGEAEATLAEIGERANPIPAGAGVAAGILQAELGDLGSAETELDEALARLDSRSPLAARATLTLAQVQRRRGRSQEALASLARLRTRPLAVLGVASWLDNEVAVAAAVAELGDRDGACRRLEELVKLSFHETLWTGNHATHRRHTLERVADAEAGVLILLGRLKLESNSGSEAAASLQKALHMLPDDPGNRLRAGAGILFGAAIIGRDPRLATESLRLGIEDLEERRRQLRAGERRTALILADEDLYETALRALFRAQQAGVEDAAAAAATLIESLRRNAIADALQSGSLDLDGRALALTEQIAAAEQSGGTVGDLREELGTEVSRRFANAYLPSAIAVDRLREVARRYGHVVSYFMPPNKLSGWQTWVAPEGGIQVRRIDLVDGPLVQLASSEDGGERAELIYPPLEHQADNWSSLTRALLPPDLLRRVAKSSKDWPEHLVLVPDGPISLTPWAALHFDGEPLITRAVIQVVPTVELLSETGNPAPPETRAVLGHVGDRADELTSLAERSSVVSVGSRDELVEALRSGDFGGVYLAMHGREMGLDQHIEFADGSTLSAAAAIAYPWPPWVLFASCLVGRVEAVAGQEPLGLGISCLLGGADTVVASVLEIDDREAASICGALATRLASGRNPAEALREVQLDYLQNQRLPYAASCLALVCVSSTAPTPMTVRIAT